MKWLKSFIIFLCFAFNMHAMPEDSVGVAEKDGKKFIKHKVDKGETLFGLSRKYNIHVNKIMDANEGMGPRLNLNQIVLIPFNSNDNTESTASSGEKVVHTVKKGETLFSIAKKYGTSVKKLKNINNISSNDISIGQEITIKPSSYASSKNSSANPSKNKTHKVKKGHTLFSIARKYGISVKKLKKWNNIKNANDIAIGDKLYVKKPSKSNKKSKDDKKKIAEKDKKHKIKKGQTLFAISQKYNVSTSQLKKWNNIENVNDLEVGDYLYVEKPEKWQNKKEENAKKKAKEKDNPKENIDIVNANNTKKDTVKSEKKKNKSKAYKDPPHQFHYTNSDIKDKNINHKIIEEGMAVPMHQKENYEKDMYLALHPSAPKSTIMRVKNKETQESIFVRVIGKLEKQASDSTTIVKLSEKSIKRLNGKQKPFKVEISYIP